MSREHEWADAEREYYSGGTDEPCASQQPRIADRCPSCGARSLFVGAGGWLICSVIGCKQPAVGTMLLTLTRERDEAKRSEDMSFGCFAMIAETLTAHGYPVTLKDTPPMFLNDAVHNALAAKMRALAAARFEGYARGWNEAREAAVNACEPRLGESDGSAYADGFEAGKIACAEYVRALTPPTEPTGGEK